jgi:phage terminase large subunit-like protein
MELLDVVEGQTMQLNPVQGFVPNGKIEEFIHSIGHDEKKWIYILPAANSLGKTAAAIAVLVNIIYGSQNEWFTGPRFEKWEYPKKFWYISEQSTLKDLVCGTDLRVESEISKWFPKGRYDFVKAGYDYYSRLTTDTGWVGTFKTFDMDPSKFESDKIGVAIFDEPPPEPILNSVIARLTLGGIIIMPMTPLYSAGWVLDRLVDKAGPESHIFVLYGDIEDNCKEHGVRGRLSHDQIQRIIAEYDPEEVEARAHGRFMHLIGLVYKGIHPSKHRHNFEPDYFTQKDEKFKIYCVMDPHDAKPPLIGWFAVDQYEHAFAVDEYPSKPEFPPFHLIKNFNLTTEDICHVIREHEQLNGWDPRKIVRVMDPNFGNKKQQSVGMTVKQQVYQIGRKMGYPLRFSTNVLDDLIAGHKVVRDYLKLTPENDARFQVGMKCENLWYQLTHYARRPIDPRRAEIDGPTERVAMKFKDGADVIRYFFVTLKPPRPVRKTERPQLPEHYAAYSGDATEEGGWRDPFSV